MHSDYAILAPPQPTASGNRALGLIAMLVGGLVALSAPLSVQASYAIYVGRDLTAGAGPLLAGTGEEVSSHWLEHIPRRRHKPGSEITVGVTAEARLPGERFKIPQVTETYAYLAMAYSNFAGFPPPLINGGLNERQLAVRDVWSPSRQELVAMTPEPQRGLSYSDLARLALERASSARDAAALMGELIERHGYATYGGNSHIFADPNEGWIVIEMAGGQGLWAAERLGPSDIRVAYPGYIGDMPLNFREHPDYMGAAHLIDFAIERGWYDPDAGQGFNLQAVYGRYPAGRGPKYRQPAEIEDELRRAAPGITVRRLMTLTRDPRIADDEAGYGQVADLSPVEHPELAALWAAPTGAVTAPFVPYYIGIDEVPAEFRQHRYLTRGADAHFLSPAFQRQEATQFAGRLFKRLMYHTCADPGRFLTEVRTALRDFEDRSLADREEVRATATTLLAAGREDLARRYLTRYSRSRAMAALRLGEALTASIETRSRLVRSIAKPNAESINAAAGAETVNCLAGADPDRSAR